MLYLFLYFYNDNFFFTVEFALTNKVDIAHPKEMTSYAFLVVNLSVNNSTLNDLVTFLHLITLISLV